VTFLGRKCDIQQIIPKLLNIISHQGHLQITKKKNNSVEKWGKKLR
jgi:hypothetical protein